MKRAGGVREKARLRFFLFYMSQPELYTVSHFTLESGAVLTPVPVAYQTWGSLNAARDNAVVVCHALTGDTQADVWWGGLVRAGGALDPARFFVICLNVIGSPYGTLSPLTVNPATGQRYGGAFPVVTIRDTVRLHRHVLDALGVHRVALAIGGSMGGMQALEWGFDRPFVRAIAPIAVSGRHSAWCIAWSEAQRQAIYADARWNGGHYAPEAAPEAGLAAARMMAMISYRTRDAFEERHGRATMPESDVFAAESYLRYQGRKLVDRFDAVCYVRLTQQMDAHDVARGRGAYDDVLASLDLPALVLGIDSDVLYPTGEQRELARLMSDATYAEITSRYGHDAFLIEFEQLNALLTPWLAALESAPLALGAR